LHKINGPLINEKVCDPNGRLHRMVAAGANHETIIETYYWLALGHEPPAAAAQRWREHLESADATTRTQKLEDFVWAMLNSRAFSQNH
jgi:hypothetical protein